MPTISLMFSTLLLAIPTARAVPPPAVKAARPAARPAPKAKPAPKLTKAPKLGPYKIGTKDGKTSLQLGFAGQIQLTLENKGGANSGERTTTFKPLLRRLRFVLGGSVGAKWVTYKFHLSTAPKSVEIMDYLVNLRFHRHAQLKVGQFKVPFGHHRYGSFKTQIAVDWSILAAYFGAERQLGAMIHNDGKQPPPLSYAVGVFAGPNGRKSNAKGIAMVFGESIPNPSNLLDPAPIAGFNPELVMRLAYNHGRIRYRSDTDWKGGPLRASVALSAALDMGASRYLEHLARTAVELLVKAYSWSMFGAFYLGLARQAEAFDAQMGQLGALLQTSYLIHRRWELSLRYAMVQNSDELLERARTRASGIVTAETDPVARAALESKYEKAGRIKRDHELTLGFNWYLVGNSLKWQVDVSWLGQEWVGAGRRHSFRARTQFQVAF